MYIALDHSPLDFAPFERRDIHTLPMRFGYHLGMHYVSGAIFGAGWVVGSLEILGRLVSEDVVLRFAGFRGYFDENDRFSNGKFVKYAIR